LITSLSPDLKSNFNGMAYLPFLRSVNTPTIPASYRD
jgi:hypothetical protein